MLRAHPLVLPFFVCTAFVLAASIFFREAIVARFASEMAILPDLLSMGMEKVPYSSGWSRIHLTVWGARMFSQHPFFGWGPGFKATLYLADEGFRGAHGGFLSVIRHFTHLHNVYLEILVRFGLLGTLIFVSGFVILVRSIIDSRTSGILPWDFFVCVQVILFSTRFLGFYEFRVLHTDFRFFALLFGGVVYTFALHGDPHHGSGACPTAAPDG
jgi:O-antigen ligase